MTRTIVMLKDGEWSLTEEKVIDGVDVLGVMVAQRMLPAMLPPASSTSPAKDEPGVLYFKIPGVVWPRYYPSSGVAECNCPEFFDGRRCLHTRIVKLVVRDSALCQDIIAKGVIDRNDPS